MVQVLPYILPLLLGRTFDLDKMQIGIDIFPKEVLDNKVTIQNPVTETHYKIVDNYVEARNLLDVEGSFSLNIKAGIFKAGVAGQYLSDTYNRENTVEVAVKATYQTVTEQLPANAKPISTWKTFGTALGTHFVRSITYGGEMIAAVRLESNNTKDKRKIKGAIEVGGKLDIFDLGLEVEGEYMKDVAKSIESTQIKIFSSIPLTRPPNDMESLKKTLDEFPEDLKEFNKGKGIPLKMELWPLSFFDSTRPDRLRNRLLETYLSEFEQKFDDLLNTKTAVAKWMQIMTNPMTDEQEKKVGDLCARTENTIRVFYEVIGALDMSRGTDQLKKADEAYGANNIPGFFYRQYLLLRQEIANDQGDWNYSRGKGITYVHWGKKNCSELAEQLSQGVVVGPGGFGGGANFLCLPESSNLETSPTSPQDAAVVQETFFQYPNEDSSQFYCSTCRLGAKGSIQVFSGRFACPNEWDHVYDGLLMSGIHDTESTSFVCLDRNSEKNTSTASSNIVVPNWISVTGRKNGKQSRKPYPCVVCAK